MVRAKFKVTQLNLSHDGYSVSTTLMLVPVTTGSEENKTFYKYTPGGSISLSVVNEEAVKQFELGKEYYVDFTKAE